MLYSMTGYANRIIKVDSQVAFECGIRSVNHRFLDISISLPEELKSLEINFREKISNLISRGKIDCRICQQTLALSTVPLKLNDDFLKEYAKITCQIKNYLPDITTSSVAQILQIPGVLLPYTSNLHLYQDTLLNEFDILVNEFMYSQQSEGSKLARILLSKTEQIELIIINVVRILPDILKEHRALLKQRLLSALSESMVNEERFQQEFIYFCQKNDVDEELSRLKIHLRHFKSLLNENGNIGKKLDFIVQEMQREINTFCAKSVNIIMTGFAIELKTLVEQLKEQIQNIR